MRGNREKEGGTSVDNLTSLVCLKRSKETQVKAADRERQASAESFCRRSVRVMRGVLIFLSPESTFSAEMCFAR
ncbi:hypothetical protein E2C01_063808 [Portunus trituberculatus]|uniref:Uncharacterized protein n=1 Tax=Portunus trituberculatus TaxID=210409 RepID=A0A5B7HIN0_PORTR|nr:hypothetical protein [Portunus trituberculatus]